MPEVAVLTILIGASSVVGGVAALAYLYFLLEFKQAETSVRTLIEGEALLSAEHIVQVLSQFKDDTQRLVALQTITSWGTDRNRELLQAVREKGVNLNELNRICTKGLQKRSLLIAAVFLALATVIWLSQHFAAAKQDVHPPSPNSSVPGPVAPHADGQIASQSAAPAITAAPASSTPTRSPESVPSAAASSPRSWVTVNLEEGYVQATSRSLAGDGRFVEALHVQNGEVDVSAVLSDADPLSGPQVTAFVLPLGIEKFKVTAGFEKGKCPPNQVPKRIKTMITTPGHVWAAKNMAFGDEPFTYEIDASKLDTNMVGLYMEIENFGCGVPLWANAKFRFLKK